MMQSKMARPNLSPRMEEVLMEGVKYYVRCIEANEDKLKNALGGKGEEMALGEATEIVMRNAAMQGAIEEVEEFLNKPKSRG